MSLTIVWATIAITITINISISISIWHSTDGHDVDDEWTTKGHNRAYATAALAEQNAVITSTTYDHIMPTYAVVDKKSGPPTAHGQYIQYNTLIPVSKMGAYANQQQHQQQHQQQQHPQHQQQQHHQQQHQQQQQQKVSYSRLSSNPHLAGSQTFNLLQDGCHGIVGSHLNL